MGVMDELGSLGIAVVTLCIVLVVGFLVMSEAKSQIEDIENLNGTRASGESSTAWNATDALIDAAEDVPDWVPIIIIVVIGGAILALVKGAYGRH